MLRVLGFDHGRSSVLAGIALPAELNSLPPPPHYSKALGRIQSVVC